MSFQMSTYVDDADDSGTQEIENLFLIDTAFENARSFSECWVKYSKVEDFLKRDEYIPLRATTIPRGVDQDELRHTSDVDGVTIEWENVANGLQSDFRHFEIVPYGVCSLKRLYPVIKKHLKLSSFSANSFRVLKECVGTQLVYDGGWETWIGFIPNGEVLRCYDFTVLSGCVFRFMNRLKILFQEELKELHRIGAARETLAKNNLNDAKRLFVLPGDQRDILQAFETALGHTELLDLLNFRTILLTFRFGEKCRTPVVLPIRDVDAIRDICVHIGHTISCDDVDLFWGRQGLQEVTGSKHITTTAFSLFECANVQSALDRSMVTMSGDLRAICTYPDNIRFVQLYNDLPHRYPSTRVHPVSGSVLMLEGLMPELAQRNLYKDAQTYMSEIHSNFFQCDKGVCRLEFVVSLNEGVNEIDASHFIKLDRLSEFLEFHPVIVPFFRSFGTLDKLKAVGLHLSSVMQLAFNARKGSSDVQTVWTVYQAELAVEKLLWGRPLCNGSNLYSTNMGPGLRYPTRCLTDQKGFLCLENSSCCCLDEKTLPPLYIFSKNLTIQRQISMVCGLYDLIGGSERVLGCRLIEMFLKDCHANGKVFLRFEQFFLLLKAGSGNAQKRIIGGISVSELSSRLTNARKMKWPYVLGAVKNLLHRMNVNNIEELLQYGLCGLGIGYFPALRNHDSSNNIGLYWQYNYGYWVLKDIPDKDSELERESASIHLLVLTELETRNLCHTSKYKDIIFPWIKCVLEKTKEKKLTQDEKVKILAFVSCVAFLQLARYVNYYGLRRLEREMPLTQTMLRMIQVQCRFELPGVNIVKIYRLHPDVPFKIDTKQKLDDSNPNQTILAPEPEHVATDDGRPEQIRQSDEVDTPMEATEVPLSHVPSNKCFGRWSPTELSILAELAQNAKLNNFQKYREYQNRCRELLIPDRSWQAFKQKLQKFKKATK